MGGFAPKKVEKLTDDQRKLVEENLRFGGVKDEY